MSCQSETNHWTQFLDNVHSFPLANQVLMRANKILLKIFSFDLFVNFSLTQVRYGPERELGGWLSWYWGQVKPYKKYPGLDSVWVRAKSYAPSWKIVFKMGSNFNTKTHL